MSHVWIKFLVTLLYIALPIVPVFAADDLELQELIVSLQKHKFDFAFESNEGNGRKVQTGSLWVGSNKKFRMEVTKPASWMLLSDGKTLYRYQPELLQVTTSGIASYQGFLQILSQPESVEKNFQVHKQKFGFVLVPNNPQESGVKSIDVVFDAKVFSGLRVDLQTGGVLFFSVISQSKVEFPSDIFVWKTPEGVEEVPL